jgi:hypothetical protein
LSSKAWSISISSAREPCDGQIGRRGALKECRNNPRREKGKRRQQPDVPLDLAFASGDRGERRHTPLHQIVHPVAGLGDRNQQRLAAVGFDRRVMNGYADDALDARGHRVVPGYGNRVGR